MRKVIRGSVYDTEKAEPIWSMPNPDVPGYDTSLYRTKSGRYFTHRFELIDNGSATLDGRWMISPISRRVALLWVGQVDGADEARRVFGAEQGERQLSVRIPGETYSIIREAAAASGKSMGTIITEAVEAWWEEGSEPDLYEGEALFFEDNSDSFMSWLGPAAEKYAEYEEELRTMPESRLFEELPHIEEKRVAIINTYGDGRVTAYLDSDDLKLHAGSQGGE